MPAWTAFGVVAGALVLVVLVLARATAAAVDTTEAPGDPAPAERRSPREEVADSRGADGATGPRPGSRASSLDRTSETDHPGGSRDETARSERSTVEAEPPTRPVRDGAEAGETRVGEASGDGPLLEAGNRPRGPPGRRSGEEISLSSLPAGALLANVAVSHGLFAAVLVAAAVLASIPPVALGIAPGAGGGLPAIGYGIGLGAGLYLANVAIAANLDRVGVDYSEALREALTPGTAAGWVALLVVVLPAVAAFEELLFRAALIGAVPAGFGVSPWAMVVVSSLAFALGHGIQGSGGVLVTGALGGVLGIAFVLSGSLLLVAVAHYVVNALEFVVHEGLGIDLEERLAV